MFGNFFFTSLKIYYSSDSKVSYKFIDRQEILKIFLVKFFKNWNNKFNQINIKFLENRYVIMFLNLIMVNYLKTNYFKFDLL